MESMFGIFGGGAEKLVAQLNLGFGPKGDVVREKLFSMGTRAVPALIKCIGNSGGQHTALMRNEAATLLGRIKDPKSVEPLVTILQTSDDEGKQNAARGLGDIGDRRAVDPLIAALKDRNSGVRSRAMFALATIRDPHGIEVLASVLHKDTQTVYFAEREDFRQSADFKSALNALTSIGGTTAISALTGSIEAAWPYQRAQITQAIETLRRKV